MIQLLPPAAASDQFAGSSFNIPCVEITDYPRGWRGLMLDVVEIGGNVAENTGD